MRYLPLARTTWASRTPSDILVIASSGGHLTQALLAMPEGTAFHVVTNLEGIVVEDDRVSSVTVPVLDTHRNALVHGANVLMALMVHRRLGIRRSFTTGGPVALPFAVVGRARRQPFVYLDTLSRVEGLSATARLVARLHLASSIYSQWPEVARQNTGVQFEGALAPLRRDGDE